MSIDLKKSVTEIAKDRTVVIDKLVKFSLTDMLLFWGTNEELAKRQKQLWLPILTWAQNDLQTKFKTTTELNVPTQDSHSGEKLKMFLETLTNKQLTGFYYAALNTRSVLLAAALIKGQINAKQAYEASCLEELWQAEKWGNDEAADCRRKSLLKELQEIETFIK
ncbi:MAG: hypothetical protein IJ660_06170 [Alphaproteobacteria bacterium]|nr:hypothetical protein [Alphaproteobacteria bacterium]